MRIDYEQKIVCYCKNVMLKFLQYLRREGGKKQYQPISENQCSAKKCIIDRLSSFGANYLPCKHSHPLWILRGFTPLSLAVERADLAVVQVLLKAGATTNIGYSPLCIASRHPASDESSGFIRALVEANAKLDQRDEEGQSPLMVAFNGEITKLLIDLNANLEDQDHL